MGGWNMWKYSYHSTAVAEIKNFALEVKVILGFEITCSYLKGGLKIFLGSYY